MRLDIDEGRFFWRVRDLVVIEPGAIAEAHEPIPLACGQTDANASHGSLRVGSVVIVGRHRVVDGEANWSEPMEPYVGRTARVTELLGPDDQGCPGVQIDADSGQWFWRIRDLRPADGTEPGLLLHATGLENDHGRPSMSELPADERIPQECARTDDNVEYGPVAEGSEVVLGRHREVDGDANWVREMEPLLGRRAHVTELGGVDDRGCALVRIDLDGGTWMWRLRDMRLP